jgi:hypothetical protein
MTDNQIYVLRFKEEEQLFAEIDSMLKKNGLYKIDYDDGYFVLSYWWGNMYKVIRADNLILRLGTKFSGKDILLQSGDVIVLDATSVHCSWFYLPRLLIGQKEKLIVNTRGYISFSLFSLLRNGILRQVDSPA